MARMQLRLGTMQMESLRAHCAEYGAVNVSRWVRDAIAEKMARERVQRRREIMQRDLSRALQDALSGPTGPSRARTSTIKSEAGPE